LLFFEVRTPLPVELHGGGSTRSMFAASGLVSIPTGGSIYGMCMVASFLAFMGKVRVYLGFRENFLERYRTRTLVATLLLPTAVFWTSGLMKEAFAVFGLGFLFYGLQRYIRGAGRLRDVLFMAFGGISVALFKSYILFPFFLAGGVWYYWRRSLETSGSVAILAKPWYIVLGIVGAIGSVVLLGELFPTYSPSQVTDAITHTRQAYREGGGASTFRLEGEGGGLSGQLMLMPMALISALFRPVLVEAHNAAALANSLEMTAVLGLLCWDVGCRGLIGIYRTIVSSPLAVFCVLFVLLFGTAVGLATPNLGSLSRYRVPMMPFYVGLLVVLIPFGKSRRGANR